jgi:hypothetical protein
MKQRPPIKLDYNNHKRSVGIIGPSGLVLSGVVDLPLGKVAYASQRRGRELGIWAAPWVPTEAVTALRVGPPEGAIGRTPLRHPFAPVPQQGGGHHT